MSDGKIELAKARVIADKFIGLVRDQCLSIEICGSVRRGKQVVGDIEIVAIPDPTRNLWARLDSLVVRGHMERALYGERQSVRWGNSYRGVMYMGAKVEIFAADQNNIGYIRALRTGPGDANTLLMTHLARNRWNVRFSDGYGWHVSYPVKFSDAFERVAKLRIDDEATFFRLVGLPVLMPGARDVDVYAHKLGDAVMAHTDYLKTLYVKAAPVQKELF